MSIALGGTPTSYKEAKQLIEELDDELGQATSKARDILGQVTSVDCVFNHHIPGLEAGRTAKKLLEVGSPSLVFMENSMIIDGTGVSEHVGKSIDEALERTTGTTTHPTFQDGEQSYGSQIVQALAQSGGIVFPFEARAVLGSMLEGILGQRVDAELYNYNTRYTQKYLIASSSPEEVISSEIRRLLKHSVSMEVREKASLIQLLTLTTGLLTLDKDLIVSTGVKEDQVDDLLDLLGVSTQTPSSNSLALGTVYGSAHRGFYHLVKAALPHANRHRLEGNLQSAGNRDAYNTLHIFGPDREDEDAIQELAAISVLEDILQLPFRHPEIYGTLPAKEHNRGTFKLARELAKESGGAVERLYDIDMEQIVKRMHNLGLVFKI